ncbi:MAG TPA: ABC transporter permease [Bryobacteraceae bacterium]|nr:ABC transporter permease [Bryobacteraceae bacterium]
MALVEADAGEGMREPGHTGFRQRIGALIRKEVNQIRRDRRMAVALVVPPTLQILLFGFALNSEVSNLRLGVVDRSQTPESRELVAQFTQSQSFLAAGTYFSSDELGEAISRSKLDAGLVIPSDFARDIQRGQPVKVQIILNAVNANNAAIGQGYARGILQSYNQSLAAQGIRGQETTAQPGGSIVMRTAFLYNPGLVTSWFIVTGTFGVLLILNGSLVASTAMIKEREAGTIEQLLMTPASTGEIIIAKIAPLFVLLMFTVLLAVALLHGVFQVPVRGSLLLVIAGAALCVLSGIGIGTFIATFTKSAQQAQLMSFFVNPPLATLSGSMTPVEAMPQWLQPWTWLNPIRHFGIITRAALVKGAGLEELWPHFLALTGFTLALVWLSVWRFRKQLG